MASLKIALLLCTATAITAASVEKFGRSSKRDTKSNVIVETISSQGRYLPPPNPSSSLSAEDESNPINVSFEAYEQKNDQPGEIFPDPPSNPSSTAAPVDASTTTTKSKKPTGGLGAFKYYGGKGKSKSSSATANSVSPSPVSTSAPLPTRNFRIQPELTIDEPRASTYRPPAKDLTYDYPSPKNALKPSKKEQKLADSRGEESSQGYDYDVGPGSYQTGINSYSSGVVEQPSPAHFTFQNNAPGNAMGMGMSYMRQSSPFFSYHVMLD